MKTVFLSGSRQISRLTRDVTERLDNMMRNELDIITGDANGADKAMQSYLSDVGYDRVTIYYVGDAPRNNVGCWKAEKVSTLGRSSGRNFYAQKDRQMSKIADCGFVLWNGKSPGSVQNIFWLLSEGKVAVVYLNSAKAFFKISGDASLRELLSKISAEDLDEIDKKIGLEALLRKRLFDQPALNFG